MKTRFLNEVSVAIDDCTIQVNGNNLSPAMVRYIVEYGLKQSIDDAGANPEKGAAGSRERLDAIMANEVPAGGGARMSVDERALREVVAGILVQKGYKKAQAGEMARKPEDAIGELTKAKGNFADVWAKILPVAKARADKLRAAQAETFDIEL